MDTSRNELEENIREWLAEQLQMEVPVELWDLLKGAGNVDVALEDSLLGPDILFEAAIGYLQAAEFDANRLTPIKRTLEVMRDYQDMSSYEALRTMAIADYISLKAASIPGVQQVKRQILGGRALTAPERDMLIDAVDSGKDLPKRTHRKILHRLRGLSTWLASMYGVTARRAADFLLSSGSYLPETPPIEARIEGSKTIFRNSARITLSIDPWVPVDTVLQVYRQAQKDTLGANNRPISDKNIAQFYFVVGQKIDDRRPDWASLMEAWNKDKHDPSWEYTNYRRFALDFRRTEQALIFPRYRFLEDNETND